MTELTPVFFIFTPDIVHFGPYCISSGVAGIEPVIILNAVSNDDETCLRQIHPDILVIRLTTSITGNPDSMLAHGVVLNDLFAVIDKPFCIQDPDCFVTDRSFWSQVSINQEIEMAGGPFTKKLSQNPIVIPNTYFLIFNSKLVRSLFKKYGITANAISALGDQAQKKIRELGYETGEYPEGFKSYFDTLQAFWLLASAEGFRFKKMDGEGKSIFHIGGTSYLHKSDYDLAHWDYWPLSVIYFNLKLLELPAGHRFHERFANILEDYQSSDHLLGLHPEFRDTWRYREMQTILRHHA